MSKFIYSNVNPNKAVEEDCVCRAIKAATGLLYETVDNLLDLTAYYTGYNKIDMRSYSYLLEEVFMYPVFYPERGETVSDIIEKYPYNTLLLRVPSHLTYAIAGLISDLWDTSDEPVTAYWIAK